MGVLSQLAQPKFRRLFKPDTYRNNSAIKKRLQFAAKFNFINKLAVSIIIGALSLCTSFSYAQLLTTDKVNTTHKFMPASYCGACHKSQMQQWSSSIMGYSSLSPVIHALELTENHTARLSPGESTPRFGRFARSPLSMVPKNGNTNTENQLFCQKCHAPVAVFSDLFDAPAAFNANNRGAFVDSHAQLVTKKNNATPGTATHNNLTAATEGVTCAVCHRVSGPSNAVNAPGNGPRPNFERGIANSGYMYERDTGNYYGPFNNNNANNIGVLNATFESLSEVPFHNAGALQVNKANGSILLGNDAVERPYLKTGEFCGSCHDVRIPAVDFGTAEDFRRVENLFTEWRNSPWNNNNNNNNNNPEDAIFVNALDNPRDAALNLKGDPINVDETTANADGSRNKLKQITTCQDCHMSTYMIDPLAAPGEYQMGRISNNSPSRRISNHRFIGVDKVLAHPASLGYTRDLVEGTTPVKDAALVSSGTLPDITAISRFNASDFPDLDVTNTAYGLVDARSVLLQKAVEFKIESTDEKTEVNQLTVKVSAKNVGTGHNIPAGLSQERQVWIELEVRDINGHHVYTSGYLQPIEKLDEGAPGYDEFERYGDVNYANSTCGKNKGALEYLCDLDGFRAKLENNLEIDSFEPSTLQEPFDAELVNYQNGFTARNSVGASSGNKVFSQFIGNAIENNSSLKPFEKRVHTYNVDTTGHSGPFRVSARLRFRPLPHEFLAALKQDADFPSSRVTDDVIQANKIIEMESDECISGSQSIGTSNQRHCNPVTPMALGLETSCQVLDNNTAQCWGKGNDGILGDGVTNNSTHAVGLPTPVIGNTVTNKPGVDDRVVLTDIRQMALGKSHNCALKTNGTVYCWGAGITGKLGDGVTSFHTVSTPQQINPAVLSNVKAISSGYEHSCAIFEVQSDEAKPNHVKCWGDGIRGALGTGNQNDQGLPTLINPAILPDVEMITSGARHNCALLKNGEVMCWGQGDQGQLGNGALQDSFIPVKVIGLNYAATYIAAAKTGHHTCAILANKQVKCWGQGLAGRLGDNIDTSHSQSTPVLVQGLTFVNSNGYDAREEMTMLALGVEHSCGLMKNGTVKCWGEGFFGATGSGILDVLTPTNVEGLAGVESLAAGGYHTCVTQRAGLVSCFGSGQYGRLGDQNVSIHKLFSPSPVYQKTPVFEDLEDINVEFTNTGNVPWRRYTGSTPSGGTGPSSGATGSASYYYLETSSGYADTNGDTALLESNPIDITTIGSNAKLSFDYHMYGAAVGTLAVDVFFAGSWNLDYEPIIGNKGNQWLHKEVDLSYLSVFSPVPLDQLGAVKVRIRAVATGGSTGGSFYQGDIAIDNISLITH